MATDEEKSKLAKLLQEVDVPEVKLSERCTDLVKDFQQRFGKEVEAEEQAESGPEKDYENPYKVDKRLLDEIDRKLHELLREGKMAKKKGSESIISTGSDPKRPWRTNSSKEKLLRIDNELKRHFEKASDKIIPLADGEMKDLLQECREETTAAPPVGVERLLNTVEAAKKNLPNFQYRRVENSTATAILPKAHELTDKNSSSQKEMTSNLALNGSSSVSPTSIA